jgi:SAM-dependent methyltransferase
MKRIFDLRFAIYVLRDRRAAINITKLWLRKQLSPLKKYLQRLVSKIPSLIRTSDHVLEKYDRKSGAYVDQIKDAYNSPFVIRSNLRGEIINLRSDKFFDEVADYVKKHVFERRGVIESVVEIGAGEMTTLARAVAKLEVPPPFVAALDISWSRLKVGREYANEIGVKIDDLVVGDLFKIPFADRSFDVVFTHYALEQSPHRNKEALQELLRITNKYLVLMEPAYELGSFEEKKNLLVRDYVRGLPIAIDQLGLNLVEYERVSVGPFDNCAAVYVIEKSTDFKQKVDLVDRANYICPRTKEKLILQTGFLYAEKAGLVYPILDEIPCLLEGNAILASKYLS